MKKILCIVVFLIPLRVQAQVDFSTFFVNQTLRIDYFHTGDAKTEVFALDKIYRQGEWAGNPGNCIQPFELGMYKVFVYDVASNNLIYTKGYSSIFAEYQTTGPALKGVKRTCHESVLIPCPKRKFLLVIEKRDGQNILAPVFTQVIDPADYHIITESPLRKGDDVIQVVNNGDPHRKVDLVILAEGYRGDEKEKFKKDLAYYSNLFFSTEPYKSRKDLFNLYGVFCISEDSGTDEPRQGIYKNTRFGSSFNAFDLDRYCLDEDNKSIRDAAASVPYDAILIMVNKDRYGGGGIYNWQTVFCTGSPWKDYVFLHELGHAFAGLGDEYFSSPVAYENFFTPGVEPLDPNITALLDTANVKWKKYLSPGIPVPTEWGKTKFDSLNHRIASLNEEMTKSLEMMRQAGASFEAREEKKSECLHRLENTNRQLNDFINNHPLRDKVGVFEGANYMSTGFYRPTIMSLMHKFNGDDRSFGIVNEQAIIEAIQYYTAD